MDESLSTGQKLSDWYQQNAIEIYDENGQLKNMYAIMSEVARIWPTLTENQQKYFLNIQAGGFAPLQGELLGSLKALYTTTQG